MSSYLPLVVFDRDAVPVVGESADAEPTVCVSGLYDELSPMLRRLLRSACEVMGASQGFFLVARSSQVYDIACAHNMRPADVINAALCGAAQPLAAALSEKLLAAGDLAGCSMPLEDGFFEANSPAVLCVPLDLGLENGALCLLRKKAPRRVSDLDLEIIQALAEQAALALTAASQSRALTRLQASLTSLSPAYA